MAFKGQRSQKKGLKNDDVTSNFYDFASRGFTETIRRKCPVFSEKVCIKECLEVEETQAVRCSHP